MLPYTGTYAALGVAIENGFRLYVQEQGGKLGGRELEYFKVDDESEPSKAVDNINKLIKRDNVDVVVGTVHSGVVMAMAKVAKDTNTLLVIPNAGARAVTGPMCAPNIFRSSFSNWQPGFAMGKVAGERGAKKVATITWKYAAGDESVQGFKDGIAASGGQVVKELTLPFPNVEFQALLTEIAATKPDAVYAFFAGGGAVKFVKDYAAAGLNKTIPLYGPGFLTDGTLEAQGDAAQGLLTTLHYADGLNIPKTRRSAPTTTRHTRPSPTCTPCRATTPRSCSVPGLPPSRATSQSATVWSPRWNRRASTARVARSRCRRRTTRCRTSTCARSSARRTSSKASLSRRSRSRHRAARCNSARRKVSRRAAGEAEPSRGPKGAASRDGGRPTHYW
jgi:ABC-type branched-subunit amino acid transport system substrate-binding protein